VFGVQLLVQTLLVQVCPLAQVPQLSVPPQPSAALPHLKPSPAQVFGVQLLVQTLLVQVCPLAQVPQLSVPPHPLEALPQLNPSDEHVAGVQAPGLMVRFALADELLQGADAETVSWS